MKRFSLVSTSEGPRREFKITWGLRAGYGPSGRIYDLEEAIRAAHRWMKERDARVEPFLSGMFTRGEVVYAGSEAETAHAVDDRTGYGGLGPSGARTNRIACSCPKPTSVITMA